jgi:predicted AAA+ superfamily ATPase
MLLRFYAERAELYDDIAYWSPAEARTTEVDFVLSRGKQRLAIEVKTARSLRPTDLRGLRAIADLPGLTRRVLVFLGPTRLTSPDGIEALPFGDFARELARDALWP